MFLGRIPLKGFETLKYSGLKAAGCVTNRLPQRNGAECMRSIAISVCGVAVLGAGLWAASDAANSKTPADGVAQAVKSGAKWLASVQGRDGGWGQDGGETSYVRQNEHLESNGNDVANTAVAALALRRAGKSISAECRARLDYICAMSKIARRTGCSSPIVNGTQIQRKLGPYIDTFLTSMLLSEVDGNMPTAAENARVRKALEKCVAKIETQSAERRKLERRAADGRRFWGRRWRRAVFTSRSRRAST